MKIAFIGAGSVGFTRTLFSDLMSVEAFRSIEVSFQDINERNLDMVYQLCQRDLCENGIDIQIQTTTDRSIALKDADYVICYVRIGGLEAFEQDINIPLKYGVDQCVGDTLCIGGIMYGQRGIDFMLKLCKDIKLLCKPDVLMLNYANPNVMMTWAANIFGQVKTIGLCHGVQNGHLQLAQALNVDKSELDIICAGINHQTWYISVKHKGEDILSKILPAFENNEELSRTEKVRIDILKRFGYYSTESNGHLSEYLSWYRKRPNEIMNWVDLGLWINGETGGYLRLCIEGRNWFEYDFPNWLKEPAKVYSEENRSVEHGSRIIEALETGRIYRGHFNVINDDCISNLPNGCVIEVPGFVDANGLSIPKIGELPMGCAAICSQSIWVQRLSVEAAVKGDISLLRQAVMMDPLTGAVCMPSEIDQMIDEMLVAQEVWLPQYQTEIVKAKERMKDYPSPKNSDYKGAARLHTKSLDEMKADSLAIKLQVGSSDKATQ